MPMDVTSLVLDNGIDLVIFDLNGTLTKSRSGHTFPHGVEDMELLPGRREALWALHRAGVWTAVATNQGGAAFGLLSLEEFDRWLRALQVDLKLDAYRVCYHYYGEAKGKARIATLARDCTCRKPHPGMLIRIMDQFDAWPSRTLMVGDLEEDRLAAERAGAHFTTAWQFFGDPPPAKGGPQ